MTLEIRRPELERRMQESIRSGHFDNLDDLLTQALDALSAKQGRPRAGLDWSQCPAVESVPGKLGGAWVFRNSRMPVSAVFENLEDGMTVEELVDLYDGLTHDQIRAVLDFAAQSLARPVSTL